MRIGILTLSTIGGEPRPRQGSFQPIAPAPSKRCPDDGAIKLFIPIRKGILTGADLGLFGPPSTQHPAYLNSLCFASCSSPIFIPTADHPSKVRPPVPAFRWASLTLRSPRSPNQTLAMCGIFGYCNYLKDKVSYPCLIITRRLPGTCPHHRLLSMSARCTLSMPRALVTRSGYYIW